jgi:hypothetical protein
MARKRFCPRGRPVQTRFAHPHMGLVVKCAPDRSGWRGLVRRRAEPCIAQRAAFARSRDWLPNNAGHCITSYPVGPSVRTQIPHASGEEATKDGTHLRERLLCWPEGGTVTIHPARRGNSRARGGGLESRLPTGSEIAPSMTAADSGIGCRRSRLAAGHRRRRRAAALTAEPDAASSRVIEGIMILRLENCPFGDQPSSQIAP